MSYLILQDGPRKASAYSVSLLAGCAGHAAEEDFLRACETDDMLLKNTARQVEPFMCEEGENADTQLRHRLDALKCEIVPEPMTASDREFGLLLRGAQGSVLVQAARNDGLKKRMTAAALGLAMAVGVTLAALAPQAHADNGTLERLAKDAAAGLAGAGACSYFGKGRGRTAFQVMCGAAAFAIADRAQRPDPQPTSYGGGSNNQYGTVAGGNTPLAFDHAQKLHQMEANTLSARDAYARSLLAAQRAQENQVLSPNDKSAYQAAMAANVNAQGYGQRYSNVKAEFVNAFEYLARSGYDMHEFSHSYNLARNQVTARDVVYPDMNAAAAVPTFQAQPTAMPINSF